MKLIRWKWFEVLLWHSILCSVFDWVLGHFKPVLALSAEPEYYCCVNKFSSVGLWGETVGEAGLFFGIGFIALTAIPLAGQRISWSGLLVCSFSVLVAKSLRNSKICVNFLAATCGATSLLHQDEDIQLRTGPSGNTDQGVWQMCEYSSGKL